MRHLIITAAMLLSAAARAQSVNNPFLIDSPWSQHHRTAGMQAATPHPGVQSSDAVVQHVRFDEQLPKNLGVSPWLVLSRDRYSDAPGLRTLWGATLTAAFKFVVDDDRFELVDTLELAGVHSMSWNFIGVSGDEGDRIIVPQPYVRGGGKFLVLKDNDADPRSPIRVHKEYELVAEQLVQMCRPPERWKLAYSGVHVGPLPTGQIAFTLKFKPRWYQSGNDREYVALLDNRLESLLGCAFVDEDDISNMIAYEPLDDDRTAMYFPTNGGIVKITYDQAERSFVRGWKKAIPYRERTGTTPTFVDVGDDHFVVTVDGKCAVTNVFTEKITCSKDDSPSKLYAVRRDTPDNTIYTLALPAFIETVENSPAAAGAQVVIANYGGYRADARKRGVVSAVWLSDARRFDLLWSNPDTQFSGVPTVSTSSDMVYSTGTRSRTDRTIVLTGLRLQTGKPEVAVELGRPGEYWDAGVNLLINDDRSMIYSAPKGVVRIR